MMMVLYHVITSYHLLNAIVHKVTKNSEKECVILLSESWREFRKNGKLLL